MRVQGDLGISIFSNRPVMALFLQRIEPTVALAVLTTIITVTLAVPIGVLAAWRAGTAVDRGVMSFAVLGFSFPVFVIGYVLIYIFAIKLKLLPIQGYRPLADGFWPFLRHLILPSVALGLSFMALIARITRASVLEVLSQDHIRTARAKGLNAWRLLFQHALPNAAVPIVTIIGVGVALLLGGVVVTESVFAIPGVGRLVVDAILQRDYPVIQGVLLIFSADLRRREPDHRSPLRGDRPAHPLLSRRMADLAAETATDLEAPARKRRSLAWHARRHPTVALGAAILGVVIVATLLAPWLTGHDPLLLDPLRRLRPPSWKHLSGTDGIGRDVWSRTIHGGRVSLVVGLVVAVLSTVIGLHDRPRQRLQPHRRRHPDALHGRPDVDPGDPSRHRVDGGGQGQHHDRHHRHHHRRGAARGAPRAQRRADDP